MGLAKVIEPSHLEGLRYLLKGSFANPELSVWLLQQVEMAVKKYGMQQVQAYMGIVESG